MAQRQGNGRKASSIDGRPGGLYLCRADAQLYRCWRHVRPSHRRDTGGGAAGAVGRNFDHDNGRRHPGALVPGRRSARDGSQHSQHGHHRHAGGVRRLPGRDDADPQSPLGNIGQWICSGVALGGDRLRSVRTRAGIFRHLSAGRGPAGDGGRARPHRHRRGADHGGGALFRRRNPARLVGAREPIGGRPALGCGWATVGAGGDAAISPGLIPPRRAGAGGREPGVHRSGAGRALPDHSRLRAARPPQRAAGDNRGRDTWTQERCG